MNVPYYVDGLCQPCDRSEAEWNLKHRLPMVARYLRDCVRYLERELEKAR